MKKILVIGGGGYLGTVLVEELLKEGYSVRILDSFIYGRNPVEKFRNRKNIEIREGDIRCIEDVNLGMTGMDAVIHLAAVVGDPASKIRPEQTIETNYLASNTIATSCKVKGISSFIYASTCSVYGAGRAVLDEDAPLNPCSLYAKTKISSEESIMNLADNNFRPVILRMSTLYGYSHRMRFDLVVNTMTKTAFTEGVINVYGGSQWRPLLNLKDAASAYIKVIKSGAGNKIYNTGSSEQNYTIINVANLVRDGIMDASGIDIPIITDEENIDSRDYRVSFRRIEDELGFRVNNNIRQAAKSIWEMLDSGEIRNPNHRVFYNHYFDSSEEFVGQNPVLT